MCAISVLVLHVKYQIALHRVRVLKAVISIKTAYDLSFFMQKVPISLIVSLLFLMSFA